MSVFLNNMCQCPLTGHTHFYDVQLYRNSIRRIVSMPSHGPHSFLHFEEEEDLEPKKCVNALSRATLISTNPHLREVEVST